jgi:fatty-acyl-CoA synthase
VLPDPSGGSRIDVRSVSRVGSSDVGANAKRVRKYLSKLA